MPRRSTFTATITHAGYKPVALAVTNHVTTSGGLAFVGNAIIGGVPGAAIDILTGSTLDLTPNAQTIELERSDSLATQIYDYASVSSSAGNAGPALGELGLAPGETVTVTRF